LCCFTSLARVRVKEWIKNSFDTFTAHWDLLEAPSLQFEAEELIFSGSTVVGVRRVAIGLQDCRPVIEAFVRTAER